METIEPKRIIGVNMHEQPCELFTLRTMHIEEMQEFLCPDGKERYENYQSKRRFEKNVDRIERNARDTASRVMEDPSVLVPKFLKKEQE
jgi:hypothetical protein